MPQESLKNINKTCFVCKKQLISNTYTLNTKVNLPVCNECKGSDNERMAQNELLEGLAEGFVCGCI